MFAHALTPAWNAEEFLALLWASASSCVASLSLAPAAAGKLLLSNNQINGREFSSGAYTVWTPSSSPPPPHHWLDPLLDKPTIRIPSCLPPPVIFSRPVSGEPLLNTSIIYSSEH